MCWRLFSIPRLQNRAPVLYAFQLIVQSLLNRVWLCDPINCSTPGFPVRHQLPELAQTHVHQISDAIQPSHSLSSPSPPAFNPSQHQGLFQWVSSSHQVAKVLELQLQPQSFQWRFRTDFLLDWLVGSPCSPRDTQESSPTPEFKSINPLALNFLTASIWPQFILYKDSRHCSLHLSKVF